MNKILAIFQKLLTDDCLDLKGADINLILTSLCAYATPAFLDKFIVSSLNMPSAEECQSLFLSYCRVLQMLVRHCKNKLLDVIHLFTFLIRGLLGGFRKSHPEYNLLMSKLKKEGASSPETMVFVKKVYANQLFALITCHGPMPTECVDDFCRILECFSENKTPVSALKSRDSLHTSTLTQTTKPFSKYLVYILSDFISFQMSARPIPPRLKAGLMTAFYTLLDLFSDYERDYLLHGVGLFSTRPEQLGFADALLGKDSARALVKSIVNDWKMFHKFTGKV